MKAALLNLTGLLLAVACAAWHYDQKDACDSFASFHQTQIDHGTFRIINNMVTSTKFIQKSKDLKTNFD
jgi:uncharacterized protein YxeA